MIQVSEALAERAKQGLAEAIFGAFENFRSQRWPSLNSVMADICRAVSAAADLRVTRTVPLSRDEGKQLVKIIRPLIDLNLHEEAENLVLETLSEKGMEPEIADRVKALKAKQAAEREQQSREATTRTDKSDQTTVH